MAVLDTAIFFVATKEDARGKHGHDERGESSPSAVSIARDMNLQALHLPAPRKSLCFAQRLQ